MISIPFVTLSEDLSSCFSIIAKNRDVILCKQRLQQQFDPAACRKRRGSVQLMADTSVGFVPPFNNSFPWSDPIHYVDLKLFD